MVARTIVLLFLLLVFFFFLFFVLLWLGGNAAIVRRAWCSTPHHPATTPPAQPFPYPREAVEEGEGGWGGRGLCSPVHTGRPNVAGYSCWRRELREHESVNVSLSVCMCLFVFVFVYRQKGSCLLATGLMVARKKNHPGSKCPGSQVDCVSH